MTSPTPQSPPENLGGRKQSRLLVTHRGPIGRMRYAGAYFRSMDSAARRERLEFWFLKPGLGRRVRRFVFPSAKRNPSGRRKILRRQRSTDVVHQPVASWVQARNQNRADVEQVLRDAQIRYAIIDDRSPTHQQIGVALEDKQRVIEAFEQFAPPGGILAGAPWTHQVQLTNTMRSGPSAYLLKRRLEMSTAFNWSRPWQIGTRGASFGLRYGTVISFWAASTDQSGVQKLYSSAPNRWSSVVPMDECSSGNDVEAVLSRTLTGKTPIEDVRFPIDLVCLWVDGSDPEWNRRRHERLAGGSDGLSGDASQPHLFRDRQELRYNLRSICEFAPFINHVYLITDRQTPTWLDTAATDLTVIDHSEIFPQDALPVFNSNAIDTRIHYIEGLAEHFLVTNDDVLFFNPVVPEDFFTASGQPKAFLSEARIPIGPSVPGEPGVDSAAKTNRDLIETQFGLTISRKFKHIMLAQRRSVRDRVASTYGAPVHATSRHPFRDMNDVAFSHLCLYDGLRTGDAVVSNLGYDYVSLADPAFDSHLTRLEQRPAFVKVLCLNDGDASIVHDLHGRPIGQLSVDPESRDRRLAHFFEAMLPTPCRWELDSGEELPATNPKDPK